MIEGGWSFVVAAYAIALGAFGVLALILMLRWRYWAARARELSKP